MQAKGTEDGHRGGVVVTPPRLTHKRTSLGRGRWAGWIVPRAGPGKNHSHFGGETVKHKSRITELLTWKAETGKPLPRPVEEIVALEDAGHLVDLASGNILWDGAGDTFSPTVIGDLVTGREGRWA